MEPENRFHKVLITTKLRSLAENLEWVKKQIVSVKEGLSEIEERDLAYEIAKLEEIENELKKIGTSITNKIDKA